MQWILGKPRCLRLGHLLEDLLLIYGLLTVRIRNSESDDNCSSLFYNTNILEIGRGLPYVKSCDEKEIVALTTVQPEYKKLSSDLYQKAVEYLPIVCVDVICQRKSDGKLLLFLRRDKPAANIWW